jgi:hypothetical protein
VVTSRPTRNGCKSCRLRRVKCDEARPQCKKCTSSGRECDYGVRLLSPDSNHSSRTLLPRSLSRSSGDRSLESLSPNIPEVTSILSFASPEDRRAYDYFLKVCLNEIGPTSPTGDAWVRIAIQHSKVKHVFHAMAAVGMAHASVRRVSHFTLVRLVQRADLEAAMRHYGKAVSALQSYVAEVMQDRAAVEPLLLACMLLVCYEVWVDQKGTIANHYRIGRRILDQRLEAASRQGSTASSMETLKHLAAALKSHGRGGDYYWSEYEKAIVGQSSIQPCLSDPSSAAFTSFIEADVHLEAIAKLGEETRTEIVQLAQVQVRQIHGNALDPEVSFCLANCLSKSIALPSYLQRRLYEVTQAHLRWLHMLQKHITEQSSVSNPILLLTQVRYFASWLVISTCRETREIPLDRFEPQCIRMLDLAAQYLQHISSNELPTRPPHLRKPIGLSFEGGILLALHLIACKCRSSAVRRRATKLLMDADRLEGTCHSGVIGLIVGSAADIEERRARSLQGDPASILDDLTSDQVPEEARFADCVVKGDPGSPPSFKLACARYLHGQDGQIEVSEYAGVFGIAPIQLRFECSKVHVFDCATAPSNVERVVV